MKKKYLILFILSLIIYLYINSIVFAQNSTTKSAETDKEEIQNSIREKVQEKIKNIESNPKAYFGVVTDISDTTIQLKGESDEILLVSVDTQTTKFIQVNQASKAIKYSDLAIGDYLIAMGFKNGNEVLEAKRILVTQPLEKPQRDIIFGKIESINKKTIVIKSFQGTEYNLEFPKKWQGPEIKELENEMQVIAVYLIEEDKNIIRTIQIISQPTPTPTPEEDEE